MPRTILLADDSLAVHRAVEKAFRDRDDEIVVTSSGEEALEELERRLPDVVLADIHMPGASGYEVATRAKSAAADLPVLLLVGTFEPLEEERVGASGADGYLMKPFDVAELVARVDALTGTETPVPDATPAAEVEPVEAEGLQSARAEDPAEDAVGAGEAKQEAATSAEEDGPQRAEEPIEPEEPEPADAAPATVRLGEADIERIARRVVEQLSSEVVERLAREVLPEIAEAAVRRRIEELEQDVE